MGKQLGPGASGDPDNPARRPEPEPAYEVQSTPTADAIERASSPRSAPPAPSYPVSRGGGWYELSDASVVRGEEEAEEAEAALRKDGEGMSQDELMDHLGIDKED